MRTLKRRYKFIIALAVFAALLIAADRLISPVHLPWKSLDPDAPIGMATGLKITMIALGPSNKCMAKLESAALLDYNPAPPKDGPDICGWKVAAAMTGARNVKFRPSQVTAQCSLALASYIWLASVNELAQKHLGASLAKVHHAGTYSCRRQKGNSSGAWSEHAFANAWDITGFELTDGRVISVLKHWDSGLIKDDKAKFLRGARRSACRVFRVVLTPDFNAAHKDHFHLDQGGSSACH